MIFLFTAVIQLCSGTNVYEDYLLPPVAVFVKKREQKLFLD